METMTRIMSSPAVQEKPVVIKSRNETGKETPRNYLHIDFFFEISPFFSNGYKLLIIKFLGTASSYYFA